MRRFRDVLAGLFRLRKKGVPNVSLQEKLLSFYEANRNRSLPERESEFQPEILVPCYNHGRFLPGLLEVICSWTYPVTVINDCSTDDTSSIIQELKCKLDFKCIENKVNLRQHGALNRAIQESTNNLFFVVNADDYLVPNWVPYVISHFREHRIALLGGANIAFSTLRFENEAYVTELIKESQYVPCAPLSFFGPEEARTFDTDNSIDMTMSGCAFLKSAWQFVGGFLPPEHRTSIHDDRDFQMRVCSFFTVGVSSEVSAFWRTNSSQGRGTS